MEARKTAPKHSQRKKTAGFQKLPVSEVKKTAKKIPVSKSKNIKTAEKKGHDNLLQKSNLLFRFNPAPISLLKLPEKRYVDINEAALKTFGFSREEFIGKTNDELNIFAQQGKRQKAMEQLMTQGYFDNYELKCRCKDGTILDGLFSAEVIEDQGDKYVLIVMIDLTSRKHSEKALRESEEKYRTILETTEEGYYEIDLAGNFTFFNDPVCKLLGYSRKELTGMNNRHYTDKETAKKVFQAFNKVYRTGQPTKEFDWQIVRKDGTRRYIEQSASLKKDSSGKSTGFRGILHDITERKKTEFLLKQSEEKYRLLADHVKDLVWLMDLDLKITYTSPSVEKITGYTLDDLQKIPLNKILSATSFQEATHTHSTAIPRALAGTAYSLNILLELELIRKDNKPLWMECVFSFIRDENGTPSSILGEGRDITERKQIEVSLKNSEENFRHSLDDSPLGVRIVAADGKTLYANKAILDIYGYGSIEELRNTPLHKRYTPESYADFKLRQEKRKQGDPGPSEYEISIIRKDGMIRHVNALRKEIFWNGRKEFQIIYQDITERREAEEKLKRTMNSLRKSIGTTIQVLGTASEARDPYTAGHQKRVADLARAIATEMRLPYETIEGIRMTGAIHDIGKISIPSEILCKPTVLTELEFSLVKSHCQYSYEIIKDVESPWPLADIVYQHHERIDGSGYPQGLKGENILIEARILAIADVVEAMISYRPYRPALGLDIALMEIENNAGILYDLNAAKACLKLFRENGFRLE
ncbi:MAG: PAS domain S-box protein [Smithella sp.]